MMGFAVCTSTVVVRIKGSSKMKGVGHVARIGRCEMHIKFWFEDPEDNRAVGRCIGRGKIILNSS
jgi:hypothetical protein